MPTQSMIPKHLRYWSIKVIQVLLLVPLGWLAFKLRTPLLASVRTELIGLVPLGLVGVMLIDLPWVVRLRLASGQMLNAQRLSRLGVVGLCSLGLAMMLTREVQFELAKRMVWAQAPNQLYSLGQHLIIGYRRFDEIKSLVERQGIGGVFITRRNIQGKSIAEIQQDIAQLQAIRATQHLPPLWIATDQEGGVVSRLSPPLHHQPPLAEVVDQATTDEDRQRRVWQYGEAQGQALANLGINVNFAPVVDLNKGIVNPADRFSVIYQRAISADQAIVTEVAQEYCSALAAHGVWCTLKHFPGLGRVHTDTHLDSATLDTPVQELAQDDWQPFQQVMRQAEVFTMLGHPILAAVDPLHPASFSAAVVTGILRQQWQHEGIVITDDFSMGAVFNSRDGFKGAVVKALNAGVDLILIAYDTDLYYPAMAALLQAQQADHLSADRLTQSHRRLEHRALRAPRV